MFKDCFQSGFLSIFYSIGSAPLQLWDSHTDENGKVEMIEDESIRSKALELTSENISSTYILCPPKSTLNITLPFLILQVKDLNKYFSFEAQILDDKNVRRRFRGSNYQSTVRVKPYICTFPVQLDAGWNQIVVDLVQYCKKAYGTNYSSTLQVQVHANCRLRRIYFAEKIMNEEELPAAFKLYKPF